MSRLLLFLMVSTQKPRRIMREGKLLESRIVYLDGEKFYVEKVVFNDWHVSIHYRPAVDPTVCVITHYRYNKALVVLRIAGA